MSDTLKIKLTEFHKDEIADAEKYRMLAKSIEREDSHWAGIFRDIANDEDSHAKAISYVLNH